jgi:purine-cytosine permease-like protein
LLAGFNKDFLRTKNMSDSASAMPQIVWDLVWVIGILAACLIIYSIYNLIKMWLKKREQLKNMQQELTG